MAKDTSEGLGYCQGVRATSRPFNTSLNNCKCTSVQKKNGFEHMQEDSNRILMITFLSITGENNTSRKVIATGTAPKKLLLKTALTTLIKTDLSATLLRSLVPDSVWDKLRLTCRMEPAPGSWTRGRGWRGPPPRPRSPWSCWWSRAGSLSSPAPRSPEEAQCWLKYDISQKLNNFPILLKNIGVFRMEWVSDEGLKNCRENKYLLDKLLINRWNFST